MAKVKVAEAETAEGQAEPKRARGGRRLTARKKLIAAYRVMRLKGLERATIVEIIEQAGVGVGSFYNHFTNKEDLAQAVFSSVINEFGAALEEVAREQPNAAISTCYASRRLIEQAERDKAWAGFIIQLEPSMQMLDQTLRDHVRVGVQKGVDSGMFRVDDVEFSITAIHALVIAIIKARLEGKIKHRAAHRATALPLRMLGVPEEEANRLAGLSMTALRREAHSVGGDEPDAAAD